MAIVEDVEAARTALRWALHNILRHGDLLTLLHVFPTKTSRSSSRNSKKLRLLRLKGFQLALSFKDICNNFPNTKVDIVVTEGDREGRTITAIVRQIGASTLVVGLHDQSFLYKLAMTHNSNLANNFNCKVLAIRQPASTPMKDDAAAATISSTNMDFSQIEITNLLAPDIPPPKIKYQICPNPSAIIWRRSKRSRPRSDQD